MLEELRKEIQQLQNKLQQQTAAQGATSNSDSVDVVRREGGASASFTPLYGGVSPAVPKFVAHTQLTECMWRRKIYVVIPYPSGLRYRNRTNPEIC